MKNAEKHLSIKGGTTSKDEKNTVRDGSDNLQDEDDQFLSMFENNEWMN